MQNSLSQVERVLDGDERIYRKGDQLWKNAPTRHQAEEMRKSTCNRLLRFTSDYPDAAKVAARLARCRERHRCLSPACPVCARAYQRVLVEAVDDLIRSLTRKERLALQKLDLVDVLAEERSIRRVNSLHIKKLKRRTTARLDGVGHSGWLIGAVDISRNVNGSGKRIIQNHWCPHVGGVLLKPKTPDFKELLRRRYKTNDHVRRPTRMQPSDGTPYAISYLFKIRHYRRVSYEDGGGRRQTNSVDLRPKEHVRSLIALNALCFDDLVYLRQCRMWATHKGKRWRLIIEPIKSVSSSRTNWLIKAAEAVRKPRKPPDK